MNTQQRSVRVKKLAQEGGARQSKVQQGRIEKWQDDKGFGFIKYADESIFFHISEYHSAASDISPRPQVAEKVSFIIASDEQGRLQAQEVMPFQTGSKKTELKKTESENMAINAKQKKRTYRGSDRSSDQSFERGNYQHRFKSKQSNRLFIALGFYLLLLMLAVMGKITWLWVGWYVMVGVLTFMLYAKDKYAAQHGQWRTPESTLHLLSAIGGWAAAMLAQTYLHHKSKKVEFRTTYYLTVIINLAVLVYILADASVNI